MQVRKAAIAGSFYSQDPDTLGREVDQLLANQASVLPAPKVLLVPHAGYIYSGSYAAAAYASLQSNAIDITRVVMFGPAHRVFVEGLAVPSVDAFTTPLGDVPIDQPGIETLAEMRGVRFSDEAHRDEHCLEVQLPFLQRLLDSFTLLPVLVGRAAPALVGRALDACWGDEQTLIVISSDLSHFHPYEEARSLDARTCARIESRVMDLDGQEACGAHAINGLMASRGMRSLQLQRVALGNSGDTAGDHQRVVGYGAFIAH